MSNHFSVEEVPGLIQGLMDERKRLREDATRREKLLVHRIPIALIAELTDLLNTHRELQLTEQAAANLYSQLANVMNTAYTDLLQKVEEKQNEQK